MLFLLLACKDPAPPGDSGVIDDAPCPAYSGFSALETTWHWQYNDTWRQNLGLEGTWVVWLTAMEAGADAVDVETALWGELDAEDELIYALDGIDTYVCDDEGLWLRSTYREYLLGDDGETGRVGWTRTTFDPPGDLRVPRGLAPGDHWQFTVSGTVETNLAAESTFSREVTVDAPTFGDTTVPAGTFSAVRVVRTENGGEAEHFIDAEAGPIATPSEELVEWNP